MILFIDNYDSFTYNLVDIFGQYHPDLRVVRNDAVSLEEIESLRPEGIVISPGPGTPRAAGISCPVVEKFHRKIPIFGVCLGHQCIGEVFGARIVRGAEPVHGKTSDIFHEGSNLFREMPSPFTATRYHSLIIERNSLPAELEITASTHDGTIMGIRHRTEAVCGVQFHPESILTRLGHHIIQNWLRQITEHREKSPVSPTLE